MSDETVGAVQGDWVSRRHIVDILEAEIDSLATYLNEPDNEDTIEQINGIQNAISLIRLAAPVSGEGQQISKEWLDELIAELPVKRWEGEREWFTYHDAKDLRNAILAAPPVTPSVGPDDELISIEVICEALHIHGDRAEAAFNTELAETYDSVIEILKGRAPAPSVGELEWHDVGPRESYCAKWRIYQNVYVDHCWLMLGDEGGEVKVATAPTIEAAKSLANSLQHILSGAAE